jgi:hypothetical protein
MLFYSLPRRCILLFVLFLLMVAGPPVTTAQPALVPADSATVRVASALTANSAAVGQVWPGFWDRNRPFLVLRPTETALLVTSRPPPAPYRSLPDDQVPAPLHGVAHLRREYPPDFGPRTFQPRYVVDTDTLPALEPKGESVFERLDFYLHESFHGYQRARWVETAGDTMRVGFGEPLVSPSVTDDSTFRIRADVERRLLVDALTATSPDSLRRLLRMYLAVREQRTHGRSRVQGVERSMERREGTATYVGCYAAAQALDAPPERGVKCIRDHVTKPLDSLADAPEADARLMRWRQYGTGAALCVMLDRLAGPRWKKQVARGAALDREVRTAVAFDVRHADSLRQHAYDRAGVSELLGQE